ncbi:MAG: bifunctional adenosylcobinamide kinase/adenosylcobinamide-phosphate guanylyltransferase [Dehalococcoidia bacterium]|nr:bifunctional adenosylcobinamide kinase/adenosylcobinamide-phosphate guanylyltransferase [Dehalococcoidia bacterium]
MSKRLTLVLGGVRAGKSAYAQRLAAKGESVLFVATAEAGDADMQARIEAHRESRSPHWDTLEEPVDLVGALTPLQHHYDTVLLDCLTLWVSNLLLRDQDVELARQDILAETQRLLDLYRTGNASWIVVSNEVGLGVVPPTELGRIYTDELGRVNQLVAAKADDVYLMAAGLPLELKSSTRSGDTSLG